jgi:hypothetical protein
MRVQPSKARAKRAGSDGAVGSRWRRPRKGEAPDEP